MWGSIILLGVIAGAVVGALALGPGALFCVAVFGIVAIVVHDYRAQQRAIAEQRRRERLAAAARRADGRPR